MHGREPSLRPEPFLQHRGLHRGHGARPLWQQVDHLLADLAALKPFHFPEIGLRPRPGLPPDAGKASLDVIARYGQAIDAIGIDQFTGEREAKSLLPGHEGRDAFQHRAALVIVARQRDGQVIVAFRRCKTKLRVDLVLHLDDETCRAAKIGFGQLVNGGWVLWETIQLERLVSTQCAAKLV